MKNVMIVTGAGQISMAIARRIGYGKKIILGDKNKDHATQIAKIMNEAGFDVLPFEMDLSSRKSILKMIEEAKKYGPITMLINGAGVSPSQANIQTILDVDLYGTAVLLEEVGKVIEENGVGVTISSQSGFRMKQLTAKEDEALACTPTEQLLDLELLRRDEVWFAEKDNKGKTELYSLEDFGPRFDKKILKAYLEGRYGAIPHFKKFNIEEFKSLY